METVEIIKSYRDMLLDREVVVGEVFEVDNHRAQVLVENGLAAIKKDVATPENFELEPPTHKVEETKEETHKYSPPKRRYGRSKKYEKAQEG